MINAHLTHEEAAEVVLVHDLWACLDAGQGPMEMLGQDVTARTALAGWINGLRLPPRLLRRLLRYTKSFARLFGHLLVEDVRVCHLEWWLRTMRGPLERHLALNVILVALASMEGKDNAGGATGLHGQGIR